MLTADRVAALMVRFDAITDAEERRAKIADLLVDLYTALDSARLNHVDAEARARELEKRLASKR